MVAGWAMVVDMAGVKVAASGTAAVASGTAPAAWEPVETTAAFAPGGDCFIMVTTVSVRVAARAPESRGWVESPPWVPGWVRRSILLPAMPRPRRRPARLKGPVRPPGRPRSSRFAAIRAARSGAFIRTWATSDAGSAADRDAAAAAEWALVILARFAEAWAMAVPVRSAGLAAAAASSRMASGTAGRVVHSAAARAVRAATKGTEMAWLRKLMERSTI